MIGLKFFVGLRWLTSLLSLFKIYAANGGDKAARDGV
jgi:hypothetical protein